MTEVKIQKVPTDEKTLPVFAGFEEIVSRIRRRAYDLCTARGFGEGAALDDWLAAEREICWPVAEMRDEEDRYLLESALSGFEPGDLEVTATPAELIVKAAHESKREPGAAPKGEGEPSGFERTEVWRRVEFPARVVVDKVTASFRNGLLKVVAPKTAVPTQKPRKVEIQGAA
jgi:HSP20 family protein